MPPASSGSGERVNPNLIPGGCIFFTVNLLEPRGNDLLTRRIGRLREAVRTIRRASGEAALAGISLWNFQYEQGWPPSGSKPTPSKKGARPVAERSARKAEAACLDAAIAANLKEPGHDA